MGSADTRKRVDWARGALAAFGTLTIVAILVASSGWATAAPREVKGLHNARYCEIIEVQGTLPDVVVTVWNTIKLNRCPAAKWNSFDAGELAKELGAFAVVLNGPRHFLMDSATAETGRVRSFRGLRMTKVATIPISNAADLVQTPYRERVIERNNTWRWKAGRTVYELIGPCGARYVMQSYSQIRDPTLKIGQLSTLGERLSLPPGWRYRSRRLENDLDLTAHGKARIVQDDLFNTYQRLPALPKSRSPVRRRVAIKASTRTVGSPSPGVLEDRGTFSGPPFGAGDIRLIVTIDGPSASGPFRVETPRGSAGGRFWMDYTIGGSNITFDGTACFAGGTGAFKGIRGNGLKAHDENTLDGQSGKVTLDGFVVY